MGSEVGCLDGLIDGGIQQLGHGPAQSTLVYGRAHLELGPPFHGTQWCGAITSNDLNHDACRACGRGGRPARDDGRLQTQGSAVFRLLKREAFVNPGLSLLHKSFALGVLNQNFALKGCPNDALGHGGCPALKEDAARGGRRAAGGDETKP